MKAVEKPWHSLPKQWWQNAWLLAALCFLTALPVAVTSIPPLVDLYGHMGRYHIQAEIADNPAIQKNWAFNWALVANLGVDLLSIPLSRVLGLERAVWLIVLAIPPLMAFGLLRMTRQIHGVIPATALAAIPLTLAFPFQFGFVNFWLGTALAFHVCASWFARADREESLFRKALPFVPASVLVWIAHGYSWGILGVIVGGWEIGKRWQAGARNAKDLLFKPVRACLPLTAPIPLMLIWRAHGEGAETLGWFNVAHKLSSFVEILRDQSIILDVISFILVVLLIGSALRSKQLMISPALGFPAAMLFGLALLFPYQLFGSAFADSRMWPIAFAVTLVAIKIEPEGGRGAKTIASVFLILCLVRIGVATAGSAQNDQSIDGHLAALDHVERGSRIAVLVRRPCNLPWRAARLQHIGSMAIVRRDAFTNTQWDVPGAQLLRPLAGAGTSFDADPSQFVVDRGCPDDLRPRLYERVRQIPRDRFDYVWVIDFDPANLAMPTDLSPLYSDDRTILYRIEGGSRS